MLEPIRIKKTLGIKAQLYLERLFDFSMEKGLYEKTLDPETNEYVYIPLFQCESLKTVIV